jgi:transposase
MTERKPYPSDLSDARWALIGPKLQAWQQARIDRRPTSQPATIDLRDVFNAILYINRRESPGNIYPMTSRHTPPSTTTSASGVTKASSSSSTWT